MATKAKKSTSVKTAKKSTKSKKPAASKAKASKSAATKTTKVTKKVDTSKVASASSKNVRKVLTPMERIRSLHITSVIVYVAFGALIYFLLSKITAEVFLGYQAKDIFVESSTGLVSANESLYSLDYRYIAIAVLGVAAIGSVLLATVLRKAYEKSITSAVPGYRWLLLGLSLAALTSFVSITAGVQDFATLKVVASLVLIASLLSWLSDRENQASKSPKKVAFYVSIFAYLAALLPLATELIGTALYGSTTYEWYVYALSGVLLLSFVATLFTQKTSIINKAKLEYFAYETRYIRINQITNFLVVLVLVAALQK